MPRARSLETYPIAHYLGVFRRVVEGGGAFLIPCTRAQAAALRGEIYAFRRAAETNPQAAALAGVDLGLLRAVAFRIADTGLEAIPVAELWGPKLIEQALGQAPPAMEDPAKAALERLKGMMPQEGQKETHYD